MSDRASLFDLTGRVAVVTGAGSGLGREFASVLADNGAAVVCLDVEETWLAETVDSITSAGGTVTPITCDVSDESEVTRAFADIVRERGRLDVLVNNAGITATARRVHETTADDWDRVIAVNLRSVFLCTRAALPTMLERSQGSIINLSSVCGWGGVTVDIAALCHYAASKAGMIGFTKQVAVEYAADGIRANAIAPGWHLGTRLGRNTGFDEASRQRAVQKIEELTPMARVGAPSELQSLLLYLASDASSFVTGQVIAHDGGWTAW